MTSLLAGGTFGPSEKWSSRFPAAVWTPLGGNSPLPQYARHALDEVTNGGFCHPVHQRAVKGLANQTERRLVAGAQEKTGRTLSLKGDLQLAF